jgi:hypothetical protein
MDKTFAQLVHALEIASANHALSGSKKDQSKMQQARADVLAAFGAMRPRCIWMLTTDTNDEDGFSIIGVFSTEEKARDFMQANPGIVYDTPFMMELDPQKEG